MEKITLGGGCFWCLQAAFKLIEGIYKVDLGYSGGDIVNPTDEQIYYENTGHAEVVQITYDPKVISLEDVLEIFWTIHDPTTLNRQGPDIGAQYRSIVFYETNNQKSRIEESRLKAQLHWSNPIITELAEFKNFYLAAEHHKYYETNRPDYCKLIINPKLAKLKQKYASRLKAQTS